MKLIIAGTRDLKIDAKDILVCVLDYIPNSGSHITEIVHGDSGNVDRAADTFARREPPSILRTPFPYESEHGRAGGPIRNAKMAAYGDMLLAIWDGESRGTRDMIEQMFKVKKPVVVVFWEKKNDGLRF